MDNLPGAVNAGIGAAGAEHVGSFATRESAAFPAFPARCALHSDASPANTSLSPSHNTQRNFIGPAMIAVRTSVQTFPHQLLRNFNGHQRTAETHVVRH